MNKQGHRRDRLYGVKGWLKFIVITNLYVAPILVGLQYILAWNKFILLAGDYPGVIFAGIISIGVDGFLVYLGIRAAVALRDIRPGAVQQVRRLLKLRLALILIEAPLLVLAWSLAGLDLKDYIPGIVKGVVAGAIGFVVGWTYFKVSKRVKATYPDWNA